MKRQAWVRSPPCQVPLLDLGLANLVFGLETRFRKFGYFTTSAIEELPSASHSFFFFFFFFCCLARSCCSSACRQAAVGHGGGGAVIVDPSELELDARVLPQHARR